MGVSAHVSLALVSGAPRPSAGSCDELELGSSGNGWRAQA
eukprot:CAMPEP_0179119074 /NCGR_PEP_ID=MMETSP0796-20121207/56038_1 /TAXON_ID=73915 /ORGANISM="Pyrodinium bahamense, Strain pbaha01" /LENGTH=39 /DNA_ID= /DNA_START= /DNA_END= /DNA_ORIENTATION=